METNKELLKIRCQLNKTYMKIPNSYRGTIDPHMESDGADDVIIKANCFGPIDPKEYLNVNPRILFLLKEPYITEDSFKKGDRGGHDQAKERNENPLGDSGDQTYKRIISAAYAIVKRESFKNEHLKEGSEAFNIFRKHVCIINVNNIPRVGGSSKNGLLKKWATINKEFIQKQIELYKPDVIIGGHTLQHFRPSQITNISIGQSFEIFSYHVTLEKKDERWWLYSDKEKNVLFIDAYYPTLYALESYWKSIKEFYLKYSSNS